MRTWLRLTIAEPFPVMWSHVSNPHRTAEDAKEGRAGVCYAPNSEWWHLPEDKAHVDFSADSLRGFGFTITVEKVVR